MGGARFIGRRAPGVLETEINGDLSLYHPASETVAVLSATASDVWRLCDGETSVGDTAAALAEAYSVDQTSIAPQVARIIAHLNRQGFLVGPSGNGNGTS